MAKVLEGLYYAESHEYVRVEGEFGFVTGVMTEGEYAGKAAQAEGILHMIRIEE